MFIPSKNERSKKVGYQERVGIANGKYFTGTTFTSLGENVTLGDIGVNSAFVPLSDMLRTLNEYGGTDQLYTYLDAATAEEFGLEAGWYYNDEIGNWDGESVLVCRNSTPLSDGQAFMLQVGSSDAGLVYSGAVDPQDSDIPGIAGGKAFVANCSPVDITLGDILVNEFFVPLSDMLRTLNEYGGTDKLYTYLDAATADEFGLEAGWYYNDEIGNWDGESALTCRNSDPVPAGFGFMLQVATEGAGIIIPSALPHQQ